VRHQLIGVARLMQTVSESSTTARTSAHAARAAAAMQATRGPLPPIHSERPEDAPEAVDDGERRGAERRSYDSRIVALVDEAARVFLGRDISTGGMRIDAHAELGLGFKVKLAIHSGPRSEPVLVDAVVDRDDGAGGVFLRFVNLSPALEQEIDRVMQRLEVSAGDGDEENLIVSELLEVEAAAP